MSVPEDVARALEIAEILGFERSCSPEVGRLLGYLVRANPRGRVGELGTGCGVSTAWMAASLDEEGELLSIDIDRERVERVRALFAGRDNIRNMHGDWRELLPFGPFDLLFVDASEPKQSMPEDVINALAVGGVLIVDDLTPRIGGETEYKAARDQLRDRLFGEGELGAVEVVVRPDEAVVLAIRR